MPTKEHADGERERCVTGIDAIDHILNEFGWPGAIDVGGIEGARWLEATVPLWVLVGQRLGRWDHAFRVVHG